MVPARLVWCGVMLGLVGSLEAAARPPYQERLRFEREDGQFELVVVDDRAALIHATLTPDGRELDLTGPGFQTLSLPTHLPDLVESTVILPAAEGARSATVAVRFRAPIHLASTQIRPRQGDFHARFVVAIDAAATAAPTAAPTPVATPVPAAIVRPVAAPSPAPAAAAARIPAAMVAPAPAQPGPVLGMQSLALGRPRADIDRAMDQDFGAKAPVVRIGSDDNGLHRTLYLLHTRIGEFGAARVIYDFRDGTDRLVGVSIDWAERGNPLSRIDAASLAAHVLSGLHDEGYDLRPATLTDQSDGSVEQSWDLMLPDGGLIAISLRRVSDGGLDGYDVRLTMGK